MLDAIRQIKQALGGRVPLIGFAGAPFTLASYAIEGGHSNNFAHTKSLMYGSPAAWHRFCDLIADVIGDYLVAQVEAGVDCVQVFDSWVGALNAADYREFILPHTKKIFDARRPDSACRRFISASAPDRSSASCARRAATSSAPTGARRSTRRGSASAPTAASRAISIRRCCSARSIACSRRPTTCSRARADGPGHIFNLGHGILPSTPLEHVQALARYVHQRPDMTRQLDRVRQFAVQPSRLAIGHES